LALVRVGRRKITLLKVDLLPPYGPAWPTGEQNGPLSKQMFPKSVSGTSLFPLSFNRLRQRRAAGCSDWSSQDISSFPPLKYPRLILGVVGADQRFSSKRSRKLIKMGTEL
jgi:hypothetical protein